MTNTELAGRGIGLTGGGGYLGSALALGLADAGATVVICGRTESSLDSVVAAADVRGSPGRVVRVVADVREPAAVEHMLDLVESEAGNVDGWVNNAYSGAGGLLGHATQKQLQTTIEGGLLQVIATTQLVAARMGDKGGSIVNVASMYGVVSPRPDVYKDHAKHHNPPAYGAAKAGVLQFTRYAACHLAGTRVRVNAVSPGAFPNRAQLGRGGDDFVDQLTEHIPLGRIGNVEEIVGPVTFLLSDSSSYVTGHNLVVDGGWTAW